MSEIERLRAELVLTGRKMLAGGLVWGNAGNISARTSESSCLITASGTRLGELEPGDLIPCEWGGASAFTGRKPSKEVPMHRAFYEMRPEINAVLHASPFYSTMVACSRLELPSNWFVEDMYYLERVERVPYCHPGSADLGEAVRQACTRANILLLENHGVLVADISLSEALMAMQTLEMVARMLITSLSADLEMKPLSHGVVGGFLENSGYRPRRTWKRCA